MIDKKFELEVISRRRAFSLLGLAVAAGLAVPATVLTVTNADAQTKVWSDVTTDVTTVRTDAPTGAVRKRRKSSSVAQRQSEATLRQPLQPSSRCYDVVTARRITSGGFVATGSDQSGVVRCPSGGCSALGRTNRAAPLFRCRAAIATRARRRGDQISPDVRYWHLADVARLPINVRFQPDAAVENWMKAWSMCHLSLPPQAM